MFTHEQRKVTALKQKLEFLEIENNHDKVLFVKTKTSPSINVFVNGDYVFDMFLLMSETNRSMARCSSER